MTTTIQLTVNGQRTTVNAPPMKRLLDVLREDLHLTGAKEGCGEGECGSCSVLLDRGDGHADLVNSCLIPILQTEGARITTIEGLAPSPRPAKNSTPSSNASWNKAAPSAASAPPA
jgi:carbon-monoxide dehydrogenase small subunit